MVNFDNQKWLFLILFSTTGVLSGLLQLSIQTVLITIPSPDCEEGKESIAITRFKPSVVVFIEGFILYFGLLVCGISTGLYLLYCESHGENEALDSQARKMEQKIFDQVEGMYYFTNLLVIPG